MELQYFFNVIQLSCCNLSDYLCFVDFLGGDPHTNHFYIGFWVICGIFGFLTLEKVFGKENEGDSTKEKVKEEKKVSLTARQSNVTI